MKPVEADQTKDQGVAGEVRRKSSLKFVTAVTHISQWSPPKVGGTALVCIGELEYSKPTWCDQNDLYLMKRYPTVAPVNFDGKQNNYWNRRWDTSINTNDEKTR